MSIAQYQRIRLKSISVDSENDAFELNGVKYKRTDTANSDYWNLVEDGALETIVTIYSVGKEVISIFLQNAVIITPDDALTVRNRLRAEGWSVAYHTTTAENSQFLLFDNQVAKASDEVGGAFTIGAHVIVPHTNSAPIEFHTAIKRLANSSIFIMQDRESIIKTDPASPVLSHLYNSIRSIIGHIQSTLTEWYKIRWNQLQTTLSSLDECLKVIEYTDGLAGDLINIDKILTAHNQVSLADTWQMFRRQANTPHNRLDLINMVAEYATHHIPIDTKIDMMYKAGDMFRLIGDLESRPVWVAWDNIDLTNKQYLMGQTRKD